MRSVIWIVLLAIFVISSVQAYSQSSAVSVNTAVFETVTVQSGDTVWNIAARYQAPQEDIRNIVLAIRSANQLNANSQIQVGQDLKVPIKNK